MVLCFRLATIGEADYSAATICATTDSIGIASFTEHKLDSLSELERNFRFGTLASPLVVVLEISP